MKFYISIWTFGTVFTEQWEKAEQLCKIQCHTEEVRSIK